MYCTVAVERAPGGGVEAWAPAQDTAGLGLCVLECRGGQVDGGLVPSDANVLCLGKVSVCADLRSSSAAETPQPPA